MKTEEWRELHGAHSVQEVMGIRWKVQPWFHSDLSLDRRVTASVRLEIQGVPVGRSPPPQLRVPQPPPF